MSPQETSRLANQKGQAPFEESGVRPGKGGQGGKQGGRWKRAMRIKHIRGPFFDAQYRTPFRQRLSESFGERLSQRLEAPQYLVLGLDLMLCALGLFSAYLLRFNFRLPHAEVGTMSFAIPIVVALRLVSFLMARTYQGIVRYTSTDDATRLFRTVAIGTLALLVTNIALRFVFERPYLLPTSVILIDFLATLFSLITYRLALKIYFYEHRARSGVDEIGVLIFGAGEAGVTTKRTLDRDLSSNFRVVGFVDDDPSKARKTIESVPIFSGARLASLLAKGRVQRLIISTHRAAPERRQAVMETALRYGVKVLTVPPPSKWINCELSAGQLKEAKIEELLERAPIVLDSRPVEQTLKGKRLLITGAAGSIGAEIAAQCAAFSPAELVLVDQAETPLYELESTLNARFAVESSDSAKEEAKRPCMAFLLADITNEARMRAIFDTYRPEVVFHAAAYKHVPIAEEHPSEAIETNLGGTRLLADLSVEFGVGKFVFVSTDKAVNPTNVMGATKRAAELYVQSLGACPNVKTAFITTRFGNVLGSNGSVLLRFRQQIASGGPVTVTHPDITRYFMTIPEACQLVLEAGAMGRGGEIYVFDMGESVRITDLAKKMIALSGLQLGVDIQMVFTGLRPGEKLYEELLATTENTLPTHHPKILIAKVSHPPYGEIAPAVAELVGQAKASDNSEALVGGLKALIPEYLSHNSPFEALDYRQEGVAVSR